MATTLKEQEYAFWGCLLSYDGEDLVIHLAAAFNEGANAEWFEDDQCRLMWVAADSKWKSGGHAKLTPLEIVAEAQKISRNPKSDFAGIDIKPDFISKAKQYLYTSTSGDMASYSKTLREGAMRRSIMSVLHDSAKEFDTADAGHVGSALVNKVTSILQQGVASKMVPMPSMTDEFMKKFDTAYEEYVVNKNYDYVSGLSLPWRHFSRRIDGLSPGLTLIAARPSVGKSSFALQILEYLAATGQKCVFNCLDMAAQQICQRPASSLSGVPLGKLKRGMPNYHEVRPRLVKAKNTLDAWDATNRLKMMTEPDVDVFVSWCIMRRAQGLLDVVCIDYVQQLQIRGRYSSDNERLTAISAKLKNLAVQYGIPVIALSQLSRSVTRDKDGEQRAPELSDLRGSGALEQDAYMVIMLYEDTGCMNAWVSNPPMELVPDNDQDTGRAMRPIWVSVKKNQNGGLGNFPFVVYQDTFMWYLADHAAEKLPCGAAQNMPKFKRITPDVRKSFLMEYLAQTNHLVPSASPIHESALVDVSEPPSLDGSGNAPKTPTGGVSPKPAATACALPQKPPEPVKSAYSVKPPPPQPQPPSPPSPPEKKAQADTGDLGWLKPSYSCSHEEVVQDVLDLVCEPALI